MTVRSQLEQLPGLYFCTITCYRWKPLFEITQCYDHLYQWLGMLGQKGIQTVGFVFMPNHLHCLLYLPGYCGTINRVLGTAKRFMAYEIIKRLRESGKTELLSELSAAVTERERKKGQLHRVFEPSFDIKDCYGDKFVWQKLDYMHMNPVQSKWMLVDNYLDYPHSSAGF